MLTGLALTMNTNLRPFHLQQVCLNGRGVGHVILVPSLKMWDQAMLVIKGVGGRIIKQKTVIDKLKKTGLPMFNKTNLTCK